MRRIVELRAQSRGVPSAATVEVDRQRDGLAPTYMGRAAASYSVQDFVTLSPS